VEAPAIWRRIRLAPVVGGLDAALEDTYHRFRLSLRHADGVVTAASAEAERIPWTTCAEAPKHFAAQCVGRPLAELAALDPGSHCTHLIDLVVLCAASADLTAPVRYDVLASEPKAGRKAVLLLRDGREALRWELEGTRIAGPPAWAGRDLRRLSAWRCELDPATARLALLMRRVAQMADQQAAHPAGLERLSGEGAIRMGACFTYQLSQAERARPLHSRRVFTPGADEPLQAERG
jgi:hypothetical protein